MELFDSHAHYNDDKFDEDREEVIESIYNSGVTKLINAGYSLESSIYALQIAKTIVGCILFQVFRPMIFQLL